jgi:hydrogenase nickel incorporation protein HypB
MGRETMVEVRLIEVKEELLAENRQEAGDIRVELRRHDVFMLNLMSSPGSGKTSLILRAVRALKDQFRIAVIEGDIDAMVDAEKMVREGIPAVQIRTGGACHLDAPMVAAGLKELDLESLDCVIKNVGNLVCPAEFDTGAERRAVILSVPEGDDKPLKYPLIFSVCDLLVINKTDYLEGSDFDPVALKERVLRLNPGIRILFLSCRTGEGVSEWTRWLAGEIEAFRSNSRIHGNNKK